METKKRFVLLAALSVVLTLMMVFSVELVRLSRGYSTSVDYSDGGAVKVYIKDSLYSEFTSKYSNAYPREYGMCLYGRTTGMEIQILSGYEPLAFEKTETSIGFICQSFFKGYEYLGSIHSHPDSSWCVLSDIDKSLEEEVMGVQCSEDKILFYTLSDGYTRGYYATVS